MNDFPRIWGNLLKSETGLPIVVKSVQKIMDARYHPDHISNHSEFELVYAQEIEKGTFYIKDSAVKMHTNDLILIKPNTPHFLKIESEKPCRFLVLKFCFAKNDDCSCRVFRGHWCAALSNAKRKRYDGYDCRMDQRRLCDCL